MRKQYINCTVFGKNYNAFVVNNNTFESFGFIDSSIEQIDLLGKTVFPGFFDSHLHLVGLGYNKSLTNLSGKNIDEILESFKSNDNDWIIGRGWHQINFEGSLTRDDLDKVSLDKPVVAIRACGHVLIANSKAIELSNVTSEEYKGGTIDLSTGEFTEDALDLIYSLIPDNGVKDIKDMILLSQKDLLAQGITAVGSDDFSMVKVEYEDVIQAYKELSDEGLLKVRVTQQVNLPKLELFNDFVLKGYPNKWIGSRFKMGPMKLLLDGSLGGQTAYMNEPYENTTNRGVNTFTQDELNEMIKTCEAASMDFAIHAIGDGAVDLILEAPKKRKTHGIIHAQFLNKRQIEECLKQNLSIYCQPIFLNSDIPIIEELVGDRSKESYLFHSMYKAGLSVSFSTDAPIESINPFENLEVSMKREMLKGSEPFLIEEGFELKDAVHCYSEEGHKQVGVNNIGKLEVGYIADFLVVDYNKSIKDSKVINTYIAGEKVF